MSSPLTILVVCNGNIHRSVIAEHCINRALKERGFDKEFVAVSRGLQTSSPPVGKNLKDYEDEWMASSPVLQEIGIDISKHQSTPIDLSIVEKSSLILAMTHSVLNALKEQFPKHAQKMQLFAELAGKTEDVPDCFGSNDVNLHRRVIESIRSVSTERLDALLNYVKLFQKRSKR